MKTKDVKRAEVIARNKWHATRQTIKVRAEHHSLNKAGVRQIVQHMQGVPKKDQCSMSRNQREGHYLYKSSGVFFRGGRLPSKQLGWAGYNARCYDALPR